MKLAFSAHQKIDTIAQTARSSSGQPSCNPASSLSFSYHDSIIGFRRKESGSSRPYHECMHHISQTNCPSFRRSVIFIKITWKSESAGYSRGDVLIFELNVISLVTNCIPFPLAAIMKPFAACSLSCSKKHLQIKTRSHDSAFRWSCFNSAEWEIMKYGVTA